MKVRIKNLRRQFGKTLALDNISFSFDSGHVFGFVGPNGAGKTTTMRILATLDEPTDGDVWINGCSVREEPEMARRMVGYVPDSLPTHGDITVHEYLDFFGRAYGLRGQRLRDALDAVEEFTNLGGIRDKLIKALSKGMKQRVSLGRALVFDPEVLVLDEPAAGLDPRARVELRELLGLLAQRNKAILISSHILTELTEICNGVVIIEKGKILETGTIEEVLSKRSPKRTLAIRTLDPIDAVIKELLQLAPVENAREVAAEIHVDVNGSEAEACGILAQLVGKGIRVLEFRQTREDLEDIFMKVTKGGVQ
ncbi:MAG TPA: ABC transporter ATP-binding protein [Candidatus Paceibacterota bacterium]|nr:ABC transporter ATP-binding protein [Verrucomicrobiota bacterium]HRY49932.1 ABC transporter ATP-binding protein [Candidatus Paceibacterota bacterium]HSA00197.1 ABC transporter ATP-binding protein [Candidatus Paceibacterota bacterium]